MTPELLKYLCEPVTKEALYLSEELKDSTGNIVSGKLSTKDGNSYPIINGIPRFIHNTSVSTVKSFGDEWNYFNFTDFKENWLNHTVKNTFGNTNVFKDKLIVDAGGGSGSQTKWFLEAGARHVIMMDLSHSVDDVVQRNLTEYSNFDIIQCSIDSPPLQDHSIDGIVYCHNVIQHTESVENTAHALYKLVAAGGEFVFNCYPLNDLGIFRWVRMHLIYQPLRAILSRMPFVINLFYAYLMATLGLIPLLGTVLEKLFFCVRGDVPVIQGESFWERIKRRFINTSLNTFDCYGSHKYQHLKSNDEIKSLVSSLQPDKDKILNDDKYYLRPAPIGCALRIFR